MKGGDDTELLEYRVSYSLTRGEGGQVEQTQLHKSRN